MNTQEFLQTQPAPYDTVAVTVNLTSAPWGHSTVDAIEALAWRLGLDVQRQSTGGFWTRYHRLTVTGEYAVLIDWTHAAEAATR